MHLVLRLVAIASLFGISLVAGDSEAVARDIVVFAAASLKNSLDEVSTAFRNSGGETVVVSYAASSTLAKQIEGGAPADMFISADLDWADYLEKRDLIKPETR